jgi:hypothetical protein
MKQFAYLGILLLTLAQLDDTWAVAPAFPSAPLADDNDEYLPAQRRSREEESTSGQEPVVVGLKPQTADFPLVRKGVSFEWVLTTPLPPPQLYVFMSLQI